MAQPNAQTAEQTSTQQSTLTDMLPQAQLDKAAYYMYHGIIPEFYEGNPINGLETFLRRAERHEKDYDELCDNSDLLKKVLKKHKIECPKFDLFPATLPSYGFGEVFYPTIGVDMDKLSIDGITYEQSISTIHTVGYKKLRTSFVFHDGKNESYIMPLTKSISPTAWDLYLDILINHYETSKKIIKENSQPKINLESGADVHVYEPNNSRLKGIFLVRNITITIPRYDEPKCILKLLSSSRETAKINYDQLAEWNNQRLSRVWNTQKKVFLLAAAGAALNYTLFPFPSVLDIPLYLVGYFALLHGTHPLASSYALKRRIQQFNKNAEAVEKMALFCKGFDEFDKLMRLLPRIHPQDAQELSEEVTQGKTLADVVDEKAREDWRYRIIAKQIDFHSQKDNKHDHSLN